MSASSYYVGDVVGHARKSGVKDCWALPAGVRSAAVKTTARLRRREGKKVVGEEVALFDLSVEQTNFEGIAAQAALNGMSLDAITDQFLACYDNIDLLDGSIFDAAGRLVADQSEEHRLLAMEMSLMPGETLEQLEASGIDSPALFHLRHEVRNNAKDKAFAASRADELDFLED